MTDSSLRMTVLLELFQRRYNALEISYMFILYEFVGIFTNLFGGIMGSRLGLRFCLLVGLTAQVIGIAILCGLQADWSKAVVIIYIVIAQGFSGIAKDLVKIGGKSVTKLVTNDQEKPRLFKLVAWLTGAKNSIKGAGFFWGAFLLNFIQYVPSLIVLLLMNLIIMPLAWFYLDGNLAVSKSKKKLTLKQIFFKGRDVNILSVARMFLFGSRDLWFEVPLPLFLRGPSIGCTPQLILKPIKQYPLKSGKVLVPATFLLLLLSIGVAIGMTVVQLSPSITSKYVSLLVLLFVGLFLFALIFAINSSIHSFLILAYCKHDKVAVNIGFYYMANALGRAICKREAEQLECKKKTVFDYSLLFTHQLIP
nr:6951_t:CDS:2 [Entrophospora candida]